MLDLPNPALPSRGAAAAASVAHAAGTGADGDPPFRAPLASRSDPLPVRGEDTAAALPTDAAEDTPSPCRGRVRRRYHASPLAPRRRGGRPDTAGKSAHQRRAPAGQRQQRRPVGGRGGELADQRTHRLFNGTPAASEALCVTPPGRTRSARRPRPCNRQQAGGAVRLMMRVRTGLPRPRSGVAALSGHPRSSHVRHRLKPRHAEPDPKWSPSTTPDRHQAYPSVNSRDGPLPVSRQPPRVERVAPSDRTCHHVWRRSDTTDPPAMRRQ